MKKWVVWLVVLCTATASFGQAMLDQGTRELGVALRVDQDEDLNIGGAFRAGYFLMTAVEVGADLSFFFGGADFGRAGVDGFVEINADTGTQLIPYAGGGAGLGWVDREDEEDVYLQASAWGGIKVFIVQHFSIGWQGQVWMASEDVYPGDEELSDSDWALIMNTRFYW
jgi:hypothetical protein